MPLSPGDRIGPYEIAERIGAGGMGEVYRAADPRMGRDVAIKVSAERFSDRFSREVHAVAALNHPNICILHDVGENYLVMELIEGPTLAERIERGAIPLEEALGIAKQIAAALEAAHEKGIVHRDLKPGNIKIKPDGTVKVLDFGLAKVAEGAAAASSEASPTISMAATQAGIILGTAAYMSPEQARGRPVDKRADIWAFGVVLYEMVTGKRLFEGEDLTDTLAAVVKTDPDLTDVPEPVRRVLQRCLQKDPNKRLRHISSVELLLEEPGAPPAPAAPRVRTAAIWWLAAALLVAAAAGWFLYLRRPEPVKPELVRFEVPVPPDISPPAQIKMSPDGRMVAFAASGGGDARSRIWIRRLDSLDLRPLPGTEGAGGGPIWLPGSRMLVFASDGKLRKIDVTGGPPQAICDAPDSGGGFLTSENRIVFGTVRLGIEECPAEGGEVKPVTTFEPGSYDEFQGFPTLLPDGRHFLFWREAGPQSGIYAGSLDAKPEEQTRRRLLPDPSAPLFVAGPNRRVGTLLFARERTLMAQTLDPERLELKGEPVALGEDLAGQANFSASDDGRLVYVAAPAGQRQLAWFDLQGKFLGNVGPPQNAHDEGRISPDGTRLAASRYERAGRSDIFVLNLVRASETRLTFGPAGNGYPVWSPDGTQIAFLSNRDGGANLYVRAADGSGSDRLLLKNGDRKFPQDWSPDGKFLLFEVQTPKGGDLWTLDLAASGGEPKAIPYLQNTGHQGAARFSPDGRYVAYESTESGVSEVYVRPFAPNAPAADAASAKVSLHGGSSPAWRADGKQLLYLTRGSSGNLKVWAADVTLKPSFAAGIPRALGEIPAEGVTFVPDAKRVLVQQPVVGSQKPSIVVVLNWQAALHK